MKKRLVAALVSAVAASSAHAGCGAAVCALSTDWDVQGVWDKPGMRLDLRAEYVDLDQLRQGSRKVAPEGVVDTHDELRTINRNLIGTLDWAPSPEWGLTIRVPVLDIAHSHIHNEDDGLGGVDPHHESWDFAALGDVQAVGRHTFYQGHSGTAGVRLGLKLPTGRIDERNAAGDVAERTLQPGTGSTDALLGLYYRGRYGDAGWFVQGMWQQSVHERAEFRPGRLASADVGVDYPVAPDWTLLVQLNVQHRGRDSGAQAEPDDSGGRYAFFSPGLSYRVTGHTQVYGYLQQPVYQYVNGTQLTADWSAVLGASVQF